MDIYCSQAQDDKDNGTFLCEYWDVRNQLKYHWTAVLTYSVDGILLKCVLSVFSRADKMSMNRQDFSLLLCYYVLIITVLVVSLRIAT